MQTDVLIIGCGIAGATAALQLATDTQRQITVITRAEEASDSNSNYAQGGIVGRGLDDSSELLEEDILAAGAGLSYPPAVRLIAEHGPKLLDEILIEQVGLHFDHDAQGQLLMGLEAAHSTRRILHVGDGTGAAIMQALLRKLRKIPNICLLKGHTVVDLITFPHHATDPLAVYQSLTCHGAYVFDQEITPGSTHPGAEDHPGDRWSGADLPEYHQSHWGTRRWGSHGIPCRGEHYQC